MFKIIDTSDSYEATILSYLQLSETSIHRDPRNKTIPMLELLKISEERVIAVTELWSPYWSRPPVVTWAEFADFVYQVLEVRPVFLVPFRVAQGVSGSRLSP
jgi:hypothetical protein